MPRLNFAANFICAYTTHTHHHEDMKCRNLNGPCRPKAGRNFDLLTLELAMNSLWLVWEAKVGIMIHFSFNLIGGELSPQAWCSSQQVPIVSVCRYLSMYVICEIAREQVKLISLPFFHFLRRIEGNNWIYIEMANFEALARCGSPFQKTQCVLSHDLLSLKLMLVVHWQSVEISDLWGRIGIP